MAINLQKDKLVSVIIPCYNIEEYIQECVESVITQTYKNIEIICVDNNSTDNTWNILNGLKEKYPHLILEKEVKAGAPAARNKGLSAAKGKWIQFLDADDLLLPTKIEHQVGLIQDRNIAFLAGAYKRRNVKGVETDVVSLNSDRFTAPFFNRCGITSSNFWSKRALNTIGGWNEDLKSSQEADLMLCLVLNRHEFITDKEPLTIIRERESGQISHRNPADKWKQYIDIRLNYMNRLKIKLPEEYQKNKHNYVDFLLVSLIILAQHDKHQALSVYGKSIRPEHSFTISPFRSAFIKLFGLNLFLMLKK